MYTVSRVIEILSFRMNLVVVQYFTAVVFERGLLHTYILAHTCMYAYVTTIRIQNSKLYPRGMRSYSNGVVRVIDIDHWNQVDANLSFARVCISLIVQILVSARAMSLLFGRKSL